MFITSLVFKTFDNIVFVLIDIDECATDPCQNGGTCIGLVNDYTCNCVTGYEGKDCQTSTYHIFSNPISKCSKTFANTLYTRLSRDLRHCIIAI